MRKTIMLILMLLTTASLLLSCSDGEEIPEGLQIAEINEEYGFKFYAPEGWMIINSSVDNGRSIWGAKMSSVSNISITLAKAELPELSIEDYFEESLNDFPEAMAPHVVTNPTAANFGNADQAYKCVYTYKFTEGENTYSLAVMQYFIENDGDFYIFTYNSYGDATDESSDFNIYFDKVELAIDNFLFTEKGEAEADDKDYPKDEDGFILVSDSKLSGYELYLPDDAEVIVSDGYVNAKLSDKANVTLIEAQKTGVGIVDYISSRKEELEAIFGEVTDVKIELAVKPDMDDASLNDMFSDFDVLPVINTELKLGDLKQGGLILYEYTYEYKGEAYHVYQIMGVDTFKGYVFTYTATEDEYSEHLEDLMLILEKVKF